MMTISNIKGFNFIKFLSDASYGIPQGLIFSFPVVCDNGDYSIVPGLTVNEFSQKKLDATIKELDDERKAISHLLS